MAVPVVGSARLQAVIGSGADRARRWSTLRAYFRLQPGAWWEWAVIWALQNVRYCPVYVLPLMTAYLIDHATGKAGVATFDLAGALSWVLLATLGLCVLTVASNTVGRIMLSRISRNLTASMRTALMRRVNKLDFAFHDSSELGYLQNKFTLDMTRLEGFESFIADALLMYGTVVIIMLGVVLHTNPLLFLVLAVAVPLNLLMVRLFWDRITALNAEYREAESSFLSRLNEALNGIRLTRAHSAERFIEDRVSSAAGKVARKAIRLDLMSNLFGSGSWAIGTFLNMCVIGLGVWLMASQGHQITVLGHQFTFAPLTIGEFTILISYYATISGALGAILGSLPQVAAASDAISSLGQIYADENDGQSARGRTRIRTLRGEVTFERVTFDYANAGRHCLAGIDLTLPAGAAVALVGPSGGGKSTIASLILGFYAPTSGRVLIDGQDLATLDQRSFRRHVGVVNQDVVLFQDTVMANIAWGDRRPDLRRVRQAAERANAMEFIDKLSDGLDHVLGDRGAGLSGGQRQRLAIARALYRDPRLLILDEATSALDLESERLVQQALEEVKKDRTTLIIAHRLSTVRKADRIIVIKDGKAVESGTYDELMARDGEFRQLVQGQLA